MIGREDVNCEVVFLNKNEPDLEFEGLLKREKTRVTYFQVKDPNNRPEPPLSWLGFHHKSRPGGGVE